MPPRYDLQALSLDMTRWRRDLHQYPELGFEEQRTSDFVAERLLSWGIEVDRTLAVTGVVGTLRGKVPEGRTIGLRADMDALAMQETNDFAHASRIPGRMHGCGHDGHTAMLLGAARHLAEHPNFAGCVRFIFQPAEEGLGGAPRMIQEGLFDRFPCDAVYGLHNWPGLPLGTIGMKSGPLMASMDKVTIDVIGKGGHGGLPHLAVDPVLIAAHIITALQALTSRLVDPLQAAVVSITCINAGTSHNVIPESAQLTGTIRTLDAGVRNQIEAGISRIASQVAQAFDAVANVSYERQLPAVSNAVAQTRIAAAAAAALVGQQNVIEDMTPVMGSEDFACMLEARPGSYVFLGQGGPEHGCSIHNPRYDFNDRLLPIGAGYWISLVEHELGLTPPKASRTQSS